MPAPTSTRCFARPADGNLALMECADNATGEARYVIRAVARESGGYLFTPFGHLAHGNPYDAYLPPSPAGDLAD